MNRIGFMQGRLSPLVNGRIQAFPWDHWQDEFSIAKAHEFKIMEWTLDQDRLYENPLMSRSGRNKIQNLMYANKISIPSITGDCFMQAPFFKFTGKYRDSLLLDLKNIIQSCGLLGVQFIVFPLVDNGRLENSKQQQILIDGMSQVTSDLEKYSINIAFESDFTPERLKDFIGQFSFENFGINYDSGNSAASGYYPEEEIKAYGQRILNVHIKDRLLNGTTVPLGEGDANFIKGLGELQSISYKGNLILQTARSDSDHAGVLSQYRDKLIEFTSKI